MGNVKNKQKRGEEMSVFYRDIDVKISDYKSELSKPLVIFERDRGLEIYFNLVEYAYRLDKNPKNLLENLVGAYATVTLVNPDGYEISVNEVEITEEAKVKFVITEDLTDELTEIGIYQLQIHVNNDVEGRDTSVFSVPPFNFEVRERLKGRKNELLDSEGNGLTDKEGYQLVSATSNKIINFSADKINEYLNSIPTIQGKIKDLNSQLDEINSSIQIPLTKYSSLVENDDWSPVIEYVISNYPEGEIFIPKKDTPYNFSRPIILGSNHSFKIDIGATIKATANMEIFIQRHGNLTDLTAEYNPYNRIYGGGFIDCNQKAKIGISLCGYRGYFVNNLTVLDALEYGIVSKGNSNGYAVELTINNVRIENRYTNNTLGTCAILINSTDNHLTDIIMVDTDIGIKCETGANLNSFSRTHHCVRNAIRVNTSGKCKSYIDYGLYNRWDTCYADTCNVGFTFTGGSSYTNCTVSNSRRFAVEVVGFELIGTPEYVTSFTDCAIQAETENIIIDKAFKGIKSNKLKLCNCRVYGIVYAGFPANPYYDADNFRGKTANITEAVNSPWINFANDKNMTCNDDYIATLNGNPQLQFVSVPTSYTSPGARGQIAHDERYLYIYIENVGWKRIDLGGSW